MAIENTHNQADLCLLLCHVWSSSWIKRTARLHPKLFSDSGTMALSAWCLMFRFLRRHKRSYACMFPQCSQTWMFFMTLLLSLHQITRVFGNSEEPAWSQTSVSQALQIRTASLERSILPRFAVKCYISPLIFKRALGVWYYYYLYFTNEETVHGHKASKSDIIEAYYIFSKHIHREIQYLMVVIEIDAYNSSFTHEV